MRLSDYPDDIQAAAHAALDANDIYGCGDDGGSVAYEHLAEIAIAYAINQERIRCIELAYKHYVYNPNRDGAKATALAIAEGKRA